jgi:hypothetical protein
MTRLSLEPLEARHAASAGLGSLLDALASPGAFDDRVMATATSLARLCAVRCLAVTPALAARQATRGAAPPPSFTRPRQAVDSPPPHLKRSADGGADWLALAGAREAVADVLFVEDYWDTDLEVTE